MKHVVDFSPTEYDVLRIRKKLQNYNSRFSEIREKPVFVISEFDKNDELIGGIACTIAGQWLEIDYLWVKDGHRGNGLGKKLLFEAEKIGMEKGCKKAFLTTLSYQAKPFYLKHGYKVVYVQDKYPIINKKYYMEKELQP